MNGPTYRDRNVAALSRILTLLDGKPEYAIFGAERLRDTLDPDRRTPPPDGHVRCDWCGHARPVNARCDCPVGQARAAAADGHREAALGRARGYEEGAHAGYIEGLRAALNDPDAAMAYLDGPAPATTAPRTFPPPDERREER